MTTAEFRGLGAVKIGYGWQTKFAKHVGVWPSTVRRWLHGDTPIPKYAIIAMQTIGRDTMTTDKYETITTSDGQQYDAEAIAILMDDELREALHSEGYETEQEFFDAYCIAHAAKFAGEEFIRQV